MRKLQYMSLLMMTSIVTMKIEMMKINDITMILIQSVEPI